MLDFAAIFGAGLLTYLTPCILPLVPIYLAALAGDNVQGLDGLPRGQLLLRALLFVSGFIAVFTAMGLAASRVSGLFLAHRPLLQMIGGVLVLLFGLKFLGAIQVPWLDGVVRGDEQRFKTRFASINAFVMGVLFAAGWSPCVGPILGSVLTYTASATASAWRGAAYLAVYGLGLAVPLLVTALLAERGLRFLKKLRAFMPKIEFATGLLLLVVAGTLLLQATGTTFGSQPEATTASVAASGTAAPSAALAVAQPTMIELYSRTCTICKQMEPVVETVSKECKDDTVKVIRIDVSQPANQGWVERYRVVGVPTFLFVDEHNAEVARLVGRQTEDTMRQALAALRGESCAGLGSMPQVAPAPTPAADGAHTACKLGEEGGACSEAGAPLPN